METVIHQSLGDIVDSNARLGEGPAVENELVGTTTVFVPEHDLVMRLEPLGHVVRVEDGRLAGTRQSFVTHQGDVHP